MGAAALMAATAASVISESTVVCYILDTVLGTPHASFHRILS